MGRWGSIPRFQNGKKARRQPINSFWLFCENLSRHPLLLRLASTYIYVYILCVTRCMTCTKQGGREQFVIGFPINNVMSTEHTHPYLDSSENKNTKSSNGNCHPDSSENQNTKSSDGDFHDYSNVLLLIKESAPNMYIKISIQVNTKIQNRVTGIFMSIQVKTKIQNRVTGVFTKIKFGIHEVRAMIFN